MEPVVTAIAGFHVVGTRYPIAALVWKIQDKSRVKLNALGLELFDLAPVSCPHDVSRKDEFHKYMQFACSKVPSLFHMTKFNMVAYLDVDMMPLRNIDELLAMDLKEGEIAMVSNPSSPGEFSPTSGLPKGPKFAFNGGLMVLRPSDAVAQQFTSFLDKLRGNQKGHKSARADQLLTARYFEGHVRALSVTYNWAPWNMCFHKSGLENYAIQHPPAMIHFSGNIKMWTNNSPLNKFAQTFSGSECGRLGMKWMCAWQFTSKAVNRVLKDCTANCARLLRQSMEERSMECDLGMANHTLPKSRSVP